MKLEFSWQIFERSSNIKFQEDPFSGSRVIPRGRTDKQTEMINPYPSNVENMVSN